MPVRVFVPLVVFGVLLSAFPSPARADTAAAEPIVIAYTAEDACPREDEFVASTRRHTTKWIPVESGAGVRKFQVHLGRRGADHAGTLVITMPDGEVSTREIVGPDCASVARALAIVVALAIDPKARIGEPGPEDEPDPSPEPATASAEPDAPALPIAPPLDSRHEQAPPPKDARAETRDVPAVLPRGRVRFTFALEGRVELTSAVTSGVLPVVGAAVETRVHLGSKFPSWLSPSLALGIRQSFSHGIRVGGGTSEFTWTAAALRLCPVRLAALAGRFEATPCAELDVGVLRADAHGLPNARSTSNAWLDRGASVRAAYRMSPSWGLGASLLVSAPVTRNRFALASGELISKAPAVGATAGLFIELRL